MAVVVEFDVSTQTRVIMFCMICYKTAILTFTQFRQERGQHVIVEKYA